MRRREFGFNLQLLSDGEIPIKEINVAALLKGHKFTMSQVCYAIIFDNKQYWTCLFLQCFFWRKEVGMQKIHDLLEMVAECYAGPHFWVQKKV